MTKSAASKKAPPENKPKVQIPSIPAQAFRFLAELKKNNEREWFNPRKDEYKRTVEKPLADLVLALAPELQRRGLPLHAKERSPVMRVYRDIRFNKDKRPFKTHVSAELCRSFKDSGSLLYLHFSPEESFVAAGLWQPDREILQMWRETIAANPAAFEKIVSSLKKNGLAFSSEFSLANMPRGYQQFAEAPSGQWLKLTSWIVSRPLSQADCKSANLFDEIVRFALAAKPLFEFSWNVEAKAHGKKIDAFTD